MPWEGPYKLRDLLDRVGGADPTIFPETLGLYVFSLTPWEHKPTDLLYLGSAHATAYRDLRQRIGEQVACALGFTVSLRAGGSVASTYPNTAAQTI
jgi:hypothetical protein